VIVLPFVHSFCTGGVHTSTALAVVLHDTYSMD
jgi:hypothetical protein